MIIKFSYNFIMDSNNFLRARMLISNLITRIPYIYLKNIYENSMINKDLKYEGNENVVNFINNLFFSNYEARIPICNFGKSIISKNDLILFRNFLSDNINNLCFSANVGGYTDLLEKQLRINKKDIINYKNLKLLYLCFQDLSNYNQIRNQYIRKINFCNLYTKYKGKGDKKLIKNYRFLFSHTLSFKILDKLLILDVLKKMSDNNCYPNKEIFIHSINNEFSSNIRENSYDIVTSNDLVLLDLSKAYPSVNRDCLKYLLMKSLLKRFTKSYSKSFCDKYFFMLKNRYFLYNGNKVDINKGISTGLASSTIIFTLIMESIVDEYIKILEIYNLKYKRDYELKIFVDDIVIKVKNKKYTKRIINIFLSILRYYKFNVNKNKCRISSGLDYNFTNIKSGDYYLGLPFSNSAKEYLDIILEEFKTRHININYTDIRNIIRFSNVPYQKEMLNKIRGFFDYKLFGLKKYNEDNNFNSLTKLINKYY